MQVAVIYSLPSTRMLSTSYSATDDDSRMIANKVAEGLRYKGFKTTLLPVGEDEIGMIAEIKCDLIFNLIEWCGQDIDLAKRAFGELRKINIPITGSDEKRFVLTGDKAELKTFLQSHKVRTPAGVKLVTGEEEIPRKLHYPLIIKPSCEHCSMGLSYDSIVYDEHHLRKAAEAQIETFRQPALAEEFIVGREFMVYLIEENGKIKVLPIEEVIFKSDNPTPFQTYAVKWEEQSKEYNSTDVVLAKLSDVERTEIEKVAKKGFTELGLWGYARFDMRMRDKLAYVLEANANPSVYDGEEEMPEINSEVIWGIKFPDYLEKIVQAASWHYERGERV